MGVWECGRTGVRLTADRRLLMPDTRFRIPVLLCEVAELRYVARVKSFYLASGIRYPVSVFLASDCWRLTADDSLNDTVHPELNLLLRKITVENNRMKERDTVVPPPRFPHPGDGCRRYRVLSPIHQKAAHLESCRVRDGGLEVPGEGPRVGDSEGVIIADLGFQLNFPNTSSP